MQKVYPHVEKICAECVNYGFKPGNPDGPCTAYCYKHDKWYPNAWESDKDPGERTCKHWCDFVAKANPKDKSDIWQKEDA
jgi:hypothetical protein